jgi:hypothetical protein
MSAVLRVMILHISVARMVLMEFFGAIRTFEFMAFARHA